MFGFRKTLDIVTLFHKSGSPASTKVATLLKQVSANATTSATEDQASDHSAQTEPKFQQRAQFDLQITEDPPTTDQLKTILEYVGRANIPQIIPGATTENEAMKKFIASPGTAFQRPVTVDWNNGKATSSEDKSVILKMLAENNGQ